jgi:YD repeat-containing protein
MQQSPIRNASFVAAAVYGHSGEFAPQYTDVRIPGRGVDLEIVRSYRSSLAGRAREMGRGWSLGPCSRIEADGDDVLYHDGCGEVYRFRNRGRVGFSSPDGAYSTLTRDKDGFVLRQRIGRRSRFAHLSQGGRVASLEDANGNAIRFGYTADAVEILDTLGRRVLLRIAGGLVREVADHAGRLWRYAYHTDSRLVEVGQPATADFPAGTIVRYVYDDAHRLTGIIDAKGQQYFQNRYDQSGRVVEQRYGAGRFTLDYEQIGRTSDGFPVHRTTCRQANGSVLVLSTTTAAMRSAGC